MAVKISQKLNYSPLFIILGSLLSGCSSSSSDTSESTDITIPDTTVSQPENSDTVVEVDPFAFDANALIDTVITVACTLTNGSETDCYQFTIAGVPSNYTVGEFCPRDIYATSDEAGIWFDGSGEVYDLNGEFIQNLPTIYNDDNWQLFDPETGLVYVTDTLEACDGAARPNVEEQYQNHCVECSLDYVDGGVQATYLIPITPEKLEVPASLGRNDVGISLNGVSLAAPAPVDAILGAYTIAAFDDCAGHINPVVGYHYHGSAGCSELQTEADGHAALIGYAMDGFGIYGQLDESGHEPIDLDECRGHTDEVRGYHYHTASISENLFIGCHSGATAQ